MSQEPTTDPAPAGRAPASPRRTFLITAVAALAVSPIAGPWVLVVAVALVVVAIVMQLRQRNAATWYAASLGVALGVLVYLVIALIVAQ